MLVIRRSVVCQLVVEAAPQRSTVMSAATAAAAGGCLVSQSTSRKIKWGSRVWAIMGPLC